MEAKIGTEAGQQKVRAWGPGLEGGVVGKSADFVMEAVGDNVSLRPRLNVMTRVMDGVTCAAGPQNQVKAYGPGLQSSGLAVGKPTEFTVDAKQGGKAPLKIIAQDGEGNSVDVQVKDNGNSTCTCTYTPRKPVKQTVMVSLGDVNIPESPFRMNIRAGCHPNKVKVSDPGVAKTGLKAFKPTYFTVDCSESGQGQRLFAFRLFQRHPSGSKWILFKAEGPGLSRSGRRWRSSSSRATPEVCGED
ncbi:filamin-A-like isoform X2 [Oreochromis aureus]|uniref:filamin-A-like isoform X2 n=1 Tax=Oreochromis aureus TaxID=47969 RepID=UPI001954977E|nr:filamin-A-like isoform X2 [Oreochromis aureus]